MDTDGEVGHDEPVVVDGDVEAPPPGAADGAADGPGLDAAGVASGTEAPGKARDAARPRTQKKRGGNKGTPAVMRTWLRVDPSGESHVLQADKYKLTYKLGIQTRDLRLLDPHLASTYPSAILCRDKSIVVNLEHIKAIITTNFILVVVNEQDPSSDRFIQRLKARLAAPANLVPFARPATASSVNDLQKLKAADLNKSSDNGMGPAPAPPAHGPPFQAGGMQPPQFAIDLPFELRALEICLDELATDLDSQTSDLEAKGYPDLDALATKVTSPRLERVRRIKNRLVRLTTRVETVREVLQKFLDDDEDMHDLNLSANEAREAMQEAAARGEPELSRLSRNTLSSASTNSSMVESEVAEVEMLLEAYFMHYDNTFNRLQTLNEYIKDTEDLVNIKLDQHRNQLITTDLILTALACAMALITAVSGVFGMNLDSGLSEEPHVFNQVAISSSVGAIVLFVGFVAWAHRQGLLVFS